MAVTQDSFTGNGTKTDYDFTFPYLKQNEIKASLDGTATANFRFLTATRIQFVNNTTANTPTAPASGVKIKIFRETETDSLAATFYAGSSIKSEDLNDNFTQNLYAVQEVTERYVSNLGGTMTGDLNLAEDVVVKFEGATDNAHETTLTVADPTADRTITLPNVTGTVVTTGDTGTVATGMIANDAINGTKIADDAVDSEHIAADSLDTEHYAPASVDTTALSTDSVTTAKITALNVTTAKIADLNVTRNKIAADAINGGKIADDSIDSEHYVDGSIDTAHIGNDQVTADKLANTSVTAGTYSATDLTVDAQGRITAASSGTIARSEIAADAIDGTKLADNAVNSEHYTDGSIDHVHLANDIIDGDNIQDDVINSEHYAAGSIDTEHIADSQVTRVKIAADAIDGTKIADNAIGSEHVAANSIGDSEIATGALDNRYYTETESDARYFNVSTGDTIKDGDAFPDNDTTIATTAAINDRIIDLVDDVGGFVPIANETSFPNANPDVNNGTGTIVSIGSLAGNLTSNGSGVITISNGTVGNSTVTITGAANSTTYSAGYGMLLETTTTLNTYTFHRLSSKATEVTTVAGSISNVNTVAGSISNVNAVAGNASNINTVAADAADIGAVAGKATEIGRLGTADAVSDMNTLGTTAIVSDLDTLADISSNITTVAGISGNVTTVAGVSANVTTVAGVQANVTTVAGSISNVNTVASNMSTVNDFAARYRVASSDPSSNNDEGDLAFNTTSNELRVYNGSAWQGGVTATGNLAGLGANTFTGNQSLGDNLKVQLGTGNDLQIYHNGSHSFIKDSGTGNLKISSSQVDIVNAGNSEFLAKFIPDGAVELYYDNSKKLETKSWGVRVTGFLGLWDSQKATFGDGDDLQIYHDGSNSYLYQNGTGELRLHADTTRFKDRNGGENLAVFTANGAAELYYNNSKKLETTSAGITVTGEVNATGNLLLNTADNQKLYFGAGNDLQIYHDGSTNIINGVNGNTSIRTAAAGTSGENAILIVPNGAVSLYYDDSKKFETKSDGVKWYNNLDCDDNHGIRFGNGLDLQLYHDGSDSWIRDSGTGRLLIDGSEINIRKHGASETMAKFIQDGSVELYYDNSKKAQTHPDGFEIISHLLLGDNDQIRLGDGSDLKIYSNGTAGYIDHVTTGSGADLILRSKTFVVRNLSNENMIIGDQNGSVNLFYDNSKKFETTSDGCTVTGYLNNNHLRNTVSGAQYVGNSTQGHLYLYVQDNTNNSIILQANTGEKLLEANAGGAVDLYHHGSKKLETTSTGVNITGALNVNGAALSSAPTVEGTASGSIADASAVIVKSNGLFEEAAETITQITGQDHPTRGSFSYTDTNALNHIKTVWCASINRLVYLYSQNSGDGLRIKIANLYVAADGGINTDLSPAFNGGGHSLQAECEAYDCAWDDDNQILFTVYHQKSSNNSYARAWTISSTGISGGSQLTFQNSGEISEGRLHCGYAGNGTFLVAYNRNGNAYGKIFAVSVNASTKACTEGSEISLPSSSTDDIFRFGIFGPPANDGSIGFIWGRYNGANPTVQARSLTVSGTTVSMTSSDTQLNGGMFVYDEQSGGRNNQPTLSYDSDNDVYLACYGEGKNSSGSFYAQRRLKCRAFRTSGTSLSTVGSELHVSVPNQASGQSDSAGHPRYGLAATYDPIFNRHTVFWTSNGDDMRVAHVTTPASSTPTKVLMDHGSDAHATTGQYTSSKYMEYSKLPFIGYIGTTNGGVGGTKNILVIAGTLSSNGHLYTSHGGPWATSSSNITAGSYIGFSSAAYSNGNTATIKTVGNTVTKSNLTPGTQYYLAAGGSLTTDSSITGVIAGKAISTTKLLIKI